MKKPLIAIIVMLMTFISVTFTACKKDSPVEPETCPNGTHHLMTRTDSLAGVWNEYKLQEFRSDTLHSQYIQITPHPLTLSANGQAIDCFTYGNEPFITTWSLAGNNNTRLNIDTTANTLPIGSYDIERLSADTLVLFQHYSFNPGNFRIKFFFAR